LKAEKLLQNKKLFKKKMNAIIESFLIDKVIEDYTKYYLISEKIFDVQTCIDGISRYEMK